ncbi:MAG: alpha/beta hydrolase [Salinisphaeraceae bacterium]|nr:alpha/beta hydrolase [Salinisphaeraceae bacterium]
MLLTRRITRSLVLIACLALSAGVSAESGLTHVSKIPWLELADSRMSRLKVPVYEAEVAIYEAGLENERAVMLVHGLGQSAARDWSDTIVALAKDYHVIAVDLPGFGSSTKGNHAYNPDGYAQVLNAVAEATTDKPFSLVGHSMGGAVALHYAALYPKKVERLMLVSVAGILHRTVYTGYLSRLGIRILPNVFPRQEDVLSGITQVALGHLVVEPEPENLVFNSAILRQELLAADPERIAALGLVLQDFSFLIPQANMPTLVVWGQNDNIAPLRTGRLLASRLKQARLRIIPGVGHSPMLKSPEVFNQILLTELARSQAEFEAITEEKRYAIPRYSESTEHDVDCDGSNEELVLEGQYRNVRITSCDNVLIRNSHVAGLHVHDARIRVENSHILGLGLRCNDAYVEVTGGSITGIDAVECQDSVVDLAGVVVQGERTALKGHDTRVYLSVSELHSAKGKGPGHAVVRLSDESEF